MSPVEIITLVISALGSGGVGIFITAYVNSKRNNELTENDARAAKTGEFEAIVAGFSAQVDQLQEDVKYLRGEIVVLRSEVADEREFINFIRKGIEEGTIPPWPDRYTFYKDR
ncbi:hypothetical protein ACP6NG_17980 [Brevibacterium casei]|uniref:hypothetical protein n=1 Tax=Brevibacterium casei TaxID=33889 RepID=UPI003F80E24A